MKLNETRQYEINGHLINVLDEGGVDKKPIIFLHHGLGSIYSWHNQLPFFLSRGFRVVAYDRWGYGGSSRRTLFSMPEFQEDLRDLDELIRLLQIHDPIMVGHSDGGTIALYYGSQNPGNVSCLIVVAAHIYVEQKMIPGIEIIKGQFENNAKFRRGLHKLHGEKTENVFYGWCSGWSDKRNITWNMSSLLSSIKSPVFVIQGADDEHSTSKHAEDIASEIKGSEVWIIPEANHMVPQTESDIFNQGIMKFIDKYCA